MITPETDLIGKHFHMLGVGGMGMAPLAIFLKQAGCRITGDDDNFHPRVHQLLLRHGIEISHKPDLASVDGVVYSNALGAAHPSLREAVAAKIPAMRRGEFLAALSTRYRTIAVAGSHGKTTTCGMLIHAFQQIGFPCNSILGGLFSRDELPPAHYDERSPWLVIEVDESDGSIKAFHPVISLIVNADWDHADFYTSKKKCIKTFQGIVNRTSGTVFLNHNCENSRKLKLKKTRAIVYRFGDGGEAQLLEFKTHQMQLGGTLPATSIEVPFDERFNAENALAALSVVHFLAGEVPAHVLEGFPGLWRRQGILHKTEAFRVIEDYGHHPTEIDQLFEALEQRGKPLVVVFQPHRYSRTLQFKYQFAEVLSRAHQLIIMDVYGAGEKEVYGGTGNDLFEVCTEMAPLQESFFCPDEEAVMKRLRILNPRKGVLLFLGAGDIQDVAAHYVAGLEVPGGGKGVDLVSRLEDELSKEALIRGNEPLANKTTLRVGGKADYYAEPANETDLQVLLVEARRRSIPVHILGRGSNLIVPDDGVRGLVIRLGQRFFQKMEVMEDGRLRAGAGVRLKELCGFMRKHELAGFEFLEGIPGNVGGALRMNAGAMGGWMSDIISEVELMNFHGDIFTLSVEELHFGYRFCRELLDSVGLAVTFKAGAASDLESIQRTMDSYQNTRKESQPRQPSAGCSFKNPEGSAAGKLIDESGLKGLRVGGAQVSGVHANFVVNTGNATAKDVISLIDQLRQQVYHKTGYRLDPEVILFGDSWENHLTPLPEPSPASQPVSSG